jgi:hypothetical protein
MLREIDSNASNERITMRRYLLITAVLGLGTAPAHAQCPPTIPKPATEPDIICYTTGRDPSLRCAAPLPPNICNNQNLLAVNNGLITLDGFSWLSNNGFCAMSVDFGAGLQLYDFCPLGCFASDTQLLTGITSGNKASYAQASALDSPGALMSMTEDATLDDVLLAPQSIKRMVHGPEQADLYVFQLANGATLRVTSHHPMVLDNGKIAEAAQITTRMSFVGIDGTSVAIQAITREKTPNDVFNFETASETLLGHVIVAEGVLVGDLKLQNELGSEESSIGLRR